METIELVTIAFIFLLWIVYDLLRKYKENPKVAFIYAFNNLIIFTLVMIALIKPFYTFLMDNYGFLFLIIIPVMIFQYIVVRQLNKQKRKKEIIIRSAAILMSLYIYFNL